MATLVVRLFCGVSMMALLLADPALAGDVLSLPAAMARALAANPAIRSEQAELQKQELEKEIAHGQHLPRADLNAGYTRYAYPTLVTPIRQPGVFPPMDRDITSIGIALSLPVYAGGKLVAGESLAGHRREAASQKLRGAGQDLLFNVTATYTKALHLRDLQQSARARIKTLKTEAGHIAQRLAEGRVARLELMRLQTQLLQARHELLTIAQGERDALSILAALLGEKRKLPPLVGIGSLRIALPRTSDEALAKARSLRPELLRAQALSKAAAEQVNIARGEQRPQVNLVARMQETAGGDLYGYGDARIGLELSFPLFDGSIRKNRVSQAHLEQRKSELLIEETANQLVSDIEQALGAIAESHARLEVARQGEREADEALRIETARYQAGESTITDLLGAEAAMWNARASRLQASYDVTASEARLLRAVGDLSPASFDQRSAAANDGSDTSAQGGAAAYADDYTMALRPKVSFHRGIDLRRGGRQ